MCFFILTYSFQNAITQSVGGGGRKLLTMLVAKLRIAHTNTEASGMINKLKPG